MTKLIRKSIYILIGFCLFFRGTDFAFGFNRPQAQEVPVLEAPVNMRPAQVEVNEEFLNALIRAESSGNPRALHKKTKARGLTQIRHSAWKDLVRHYPAKYKNLNYKEDIFRSQVAREASRDYLNLIKYYLVKNNLPANLENILAAYNWGIGNLRKLGLDYAPRETKNYIQKIRRHLSESSS